jgi:acid phosphatase
MRHSIVLLITVTIAAACAARGTAPTPGPRPSPPSSSFADQNLNAVLWMQSALEYEASALQAYRTARLQLEYALKTPAWTAAIEQTGNVAGLPPAVILDIDETVLDNSYYQARMIREGTAYSDATWNAWVEERKATPIPGALEFTREAARQGVTVFYVTNRVQNGEPATRDNLAALGFPLDATIDTVLTRGERSEWQASAKGPRRSHVAERFRILLLVGDDLGDFVTNASGTPEDRITRTAAYDDRWGRQWIMLPNPTYGSWERAVLGEAGDPIAVKRRALRFSPQ